jgi:hypothetical protein
VTVEDELPEKVRLTGTIVLADVTGDVAQYALTPTITPLPSSFIWEGSMGASSKFKLIVRAEVITVPWNSTNTVRITVDGDTITRIASGGEPEGGIFLPLILKNN